MTDIFNPTIQGGSGVDFRSTADTTVDAPDRSIEEAANIVATVGGIAADEAQRQAIRGSAANISEVDGVAGEVDLQDKNFIDRELDLTRIAELRKAGSISGAKAAALVRVKSKRMIQQNPFLADKVRQEVRSFFDDGVGSTAAKFFKDEVTQEQREIAELRAESVKAGDLMPGETDPEKINKAMSATFQRRQLTTALDENKNLLAAANAELTQKTKLDQIRKSELEQQRAAAREALDTKGQELAFSYTDQLAELGNQIARDMENPNFDPSDAIARIETISNQLNTELQFGAEGDTQFINDSRIAFDGIMQTMFDVINGKRELEALDSVIQRNRKTIQIELLKDPELRKADAISKLAPNDPVTQQQYGLALSTAKSEMGRKFQTDNAAGVGEGESTSIGGNYHVGLNLVNDSDSYKGYAERVKASSAAIVSGELGEDALPEFSRNVNSMLRSVGDYQALVKGPRELNETIDMLADKDFGEVISNNPDLLRDPELAEEAGKVIKAKYMGQLSDAIGSELKKKITIQPPRPFGSLSVPANTVAPVPFEDFVDFEVSNGEARFVVADDVDAGVKSQVMREVNKLNSRVFNPMNKFIRASAHLSGTTDYQKFLEENAEAIFQGASLNGEQLAAAVSQEEELALTEMQASGEGEPTSRPDGVYRNQQTGQVMRVEGGVAYIVGG